MWSDVIIYDKYTEIKMCDLEPFSKIRSPITTLSFYNYPTTVHVRVDTHVDPYTSLEEVDGGVCNLHINPDGGHLDHRHRIIKYFLPVM